MASSRRAMSIIREAYPGPDAGPVSTDAAGRSRAGLLTRRSSGARIEAGTLRSATVDHPVGWMTALPAGARSAKGLPLILCLPGRGGGARWVDRALFLQDAAARAGLHAALAAVDSGQSYWHPRTSGEDRLAMLFDEALPLFERRLGAPARRALMGWSMGGYGALLAAELQPARSLRWLSRVLPSGPHTRPSTPPFPTPSTARPTTPPTTCCAERLGCGASRSGSTAATPTRSCPASAACAPACTRRRPAAPSPAPRPRYWRRVAPLQVAWLRRTLA